MNEEYKQWKRWMAEPPILIGFCISAWLLLTLVFNFIYNVISLLFSSLSGSNISSFSAHLGVFSYRFKTKGFGMILPNIAKTSYWIIYILILVIASFFIFKLLYNVRRSFRDLNKGTKGTSRWTTVEEVRKQYPSASLDKHDEIEGQIGVPVMVDSDRKTVYYDPNNTNSKVMGGTQTGKTQYITYPTIDLNLRCTIPDSMVINDIKGDITRKTWEHPRLNEKFNKYCFNLVNPRNSLRFNPIANVAKYWQTDNARAQTIVKSTGHTFYYEPEAKDQIWNDGAQAIYETYVSLLAEIATKEGHPEWVNLNAVTNLARRMSRDGDKDDKGNTLIDQYVSKLSPSNLISKLYDQMLNATNDQKRSYDTIFKGKLNFLNSSEMAELVSANDLDFNELVYPSDGKPTMLFVIFPYTDKSFENILSLFYNQMYQTISETATKKGGKFARRLHTVFEEFTNTPKIENIAAILNVGLEAGNKFTLFSQSSHQTINRYGQELGKVILQATGNSFFIMSDDNEDADSFARDLGETTVIEEQRSGDPLNVNKSYTEMEGSRSLMQANELRKLLQSEAVLNRTKLRKDLKGNDVRPYPIKAFKKEIKHMTAEGSVSEFKDETNLMGAYEYLFADAGGDFDDKGKSLDEFDFRVFSDPLITRRQRKGWKIKREFNEEDFVLPQDIFEKYIINFIKGSKTNSPKTTHKKGDKHPVTPPHEIVPTPVTPQDNDNVEVEEVEEIESLDHAITRLDANVEDHSGKFDNGLIEDVYVVDKLINLFRVYMGEMQAVYVEHDVKTVGQLTTYINNLSNNPANQEKMKELKQDLQYIMNNKGG